MTKTIDELSRELAVAAAAEGKSVHVFLSPITSDSQGDGSGFAAAALAAVMASVVQAPKFDGALSLDKIHVCNCHKETPEEDGAEPSSSIAQ